jgi:hypothetical protein
MPSKTPLRYKHRVTNNGIILGYYCIRSVTHHYVHVNLATDSYCLHVDLSIFGIILDIPILGSSEVVKNSDPCIGGMLVHKVRVSAIHIVAGGLGILNGSGNVSRPHAVNTVLQEEVEVGFLTKTEDASKFIILLSDCMYFDPVEVVIIH